MSYCEYVRGEPLLIKQQGIYLPRAFRKAQLTLYFNLECGSFGDSEGNGECMNAIIREWKKRIKSGDTTKKKGQSP